MEQIKQFMNKPNKPKVKEIKKTNGREQFQMI
jgi:hypothetical protein